MAPARAWVELDEQGDSSKPIPPAAETAESATRSAEAAPAHGSASAKDGARSWLAFGTIQSADFGLNSTFTVLSLALPSLMKHFHTTEDVVIWVTLAPMIISACLAPVSGWLADAHGRKPFWLGGMAINLLALLISGTASSIWLLLFGRALQGVGQGCDGPSGSALILSGFSERKRGRVLGIREGMGALAPSVGIIVGGMVLGQAGGDGWRILFIAPMPLVALAAIVVGVLVKPQPQEKHSTQGTFDLAGSILVFIAVSTLLFSLNQGVRQGWTSPVILTAASISALALAALVFVERRAKAPILDPAIARDRVLVCAIACRLLHTCAYFAAFVITPFLVEEVLGFDAFHASWILLIRTGATVLLNFGVGFLADRAEPSYFPIVGMSCGLSGYLLYSLLLDEMAAAPSYGALVRLFIPPLALQGVNGSCIWGPTTKLVANRVPQQRLASFMGVMRIFGTLGAVSGFSLGLGVVTVSGGLTSLDAYRTALRVDVVIAAIAMPFAVGLGWLHFVGYPNPWKAARADGAALGPAAEA